MRYVIRPGYVVSRQDGQRHFVGVGQLLWLYRVPRGAQYTVVDETRERNVGFIERPDDIVCRPRYDGNYPVFA